MRHSVRAAIDPVDPFANNMGWSIDFHHRQLGCGGEKRTKPMTDARTQLDSDTAERAALSAETWDCRCMTREYPRLDPACPQHNILYAEHLNAVAVDESEGSPLASVAY